MSKKLLYSLLAIGLIILLISSIYCASTMQQRKINQLKKQVALLKQEMVPMRFKILGRSNDTIYVSFKFYDMDGNVVYYYDDQGNKQEFVRMKLPGKELAFDFIVVPVGGKFFAFPYKVFTDAIAPKYGIVLFKYYTRDNYPQIYYSQDNTPVFDAGVKALYTKILRGDVQDLKNAFGSLVQDVHNFSQFEVGQVYKLIFHPAQGGIEIVKQ